MNVFYEGMPIRTTYKDKDVTAEIKKQTSNDYFVVYWKIGKKHNEERVNRLMSKQELQEIVSGRSSLKEIKYY